MSLELPEKWTTQERKQEQDKITEEDIQKKYGSAEEKAEKKVETEEESEHPDYCPNCQTFNYHVLDCSNCGYSKITGGKI